jgi:hypothetical protein
MTVFVVTVTNMEDEGETTVVGVKRTKDAARELMRAKAREDATDEDTDEVDEEDLDERDDEISASGGMVLYQIHESELTD